MNYFLKQVSARELYSNSMYWTRVYISPFSAVVQNTGDWIIYTEKSFNLFSVEPESPR